MLPIIGARDYIEPRGFFIHECPACHTQRVFSVYDTRRKLTLYFIPTVNVRSQQVMECTTCHGRWGIPDDQVNALQHRLMTQEQVTEKLYQARKPPELPRRARTFYQVLQVDQEAERDVIEAAFRRLAMKYHPDTNPSPEAQGRMREILQARDILLDEVRRAQYDRSLGIVRRVEALRPEEV
ncbi:MAG TPA: DnaJ domain-containing protein [Thermomicrobiales bacterium]|nr:DnaJ domain-containing protein [Thermomicrobiales bacterium]